MSSPKLMVLSPLVDRHAVGEVVDQRAVYVPPLAPAGSPVVIAVRLVGAHYDGGFFLTMLIDVGSVVDADVGVHVGVDSFR